ncbi:Oxysterol-binding protein-related protein 9 [Strongyloides ratti]|uniref:Oxysterol-binding protein n=1 Tax=Strongyloides ratti TaxID=34506 RepID=A0A090LBP1_STRRB|nr:Oxysterol-binding protein-related protein 9 [Strongyloides ratti]CEF67157.1 Oxysterol-binding protein-related protein 9 [Strongyloides ratti]
MEGPLSKWTNLVHGWQYRWFVLQNDILVYYTSREKMLRRQQRGCIRLRGATIGIDGVNNSLFTVSVDNKIFHLQGRDQNERDKWVRALEKTIHNLCGYYKPAEQDPLTLLNEKLLEADNHLKVAMEEVHILESIEETSTNEKKAKIKEILKSGNILLDTIRSSVIFLQMVKSQIDSNATRKTRSGSLAPSNNGTDDDKSVSPVATIKNEEKEVVNIVPPMSYSSSEDEDEFFDARSLNGEKNHSSLNSEKRISASSFPIDEGIMRVYNQTDVEPDWDDNHEDFDQIYENNEESDLGNVQQQHGSVLMHLLSQVSVGMDLTKVTLPTFILERRSLLEMYADFFAHPDDFVSGTDLETPESRFIAVVRYYLSAFYPARKSGVAKKPYNPILGETFRCRWTVPGMELTGERTTSGPFPGSDKNQLTFIAEQVSHHPPISAFYAEHPGKRISFNGFIWTKSSFLGLSIGVANIGFGTVTLHDYDEVYKLTFPSGYGRSIMGTPWIELGGRIEVSCEKTGYTAEIDFLTKSFFGGKPHRLSGSLFKPGVKKPILTLRGEWNGIIYAKPLNGDEYVFVDVKAKSEIRKECDPIAKMGDRESRRLWRHVTTALFRNKISLATNSKLWIEQRQRDEAKKRKEKGEVWNNIFFKKQDDNWVYENSLGKRTEI